MSELKLVCPLLDGFVMGNPMSDRDGVKCCPAMKENSDEKYIVKIISVPASQVQLDALLLTGAYKDPADATDYFREVADGIAAEAEILNTLSKLEGFIAFDGCQVAPMKDGKLGYEVSLLGTYKRTLLRHIQRNPVTHLEAVNLGLDLCTALAVCRRAGYLYVDLKPSNVFLSRDRQARIGDLGFVKLDSLAYTSLPGKYRSPYSPAEVQDDLKVLNDTVDTYAVGMILYQIYNEGALPKAPLEPKDPFPHPANADYEIGSIIMKALDPDPARRWKDPMEMGQALVGYMQRNTVNNVPITPPAGLYVGDMPELIREEPVTEAAPADDQAEAPASPEPIPEAEAPRAPAPEAEIPEVPPQEMLPLDQSESQAPLSEEEQENLDFSAVFAAAPQEEPKAKPWPEPPKPLPLRKSTRHIGKWILSLAVVLLVLAGLAFGGFWFYENLYLKTIDDLTLTGNQHELVVSVDTAMDTSLLRVSCTDTYGNSQVQRIVDGKAVFTDLLPDSLYRIELAVEGFHGLTGKTAEIFTTDAMPTIVSMSAVTGAEDGSVILNFTVDGDDPAEWTVLCSTPGEEDILQTFTGHSVTIKGLSVGKTYTMTLGAANGDQILGECTMDFVAAGLVLAENLEIANLTDGVMTVRWDAPEDTAVNTWHVRCYNNEGHEEVLEIGGTEIAFTGIDTTKDYTVEVTADGMTQTNRISITANPLTITNITVDAEEPGQLQVSWNHDGEAPADGWLLFYTLDGGSERSVVKCPENAGLVDVRIPGARYHFEIQAADATTVFNGHHSFTCPDAEVFVFEGLDAKKISSNLLVTPEEEGWTVESAGENYTDTFAPGESISIAMFADDNFYLPETDIEILYVIRDGEGNVLSTLISRETRQWKGIWYDEDYHNGELTLPETPEEPGEYTVNVYFDNQYVTSAGFTISE